MSPYVNPEDNSNNVSISESCKKKSLKLLCPLCVEVLLQLESILSDLEWNHLEAATIDVL